MIYVLGYSAAPGYYLNYDGTWLPLPTSRNSGQIPCFGMGTGKNQISQITIDSSQPNLSARVYFFIDDQGIYSGGCNNGTLSAGSGGTNGIFGTKSFSYTYSGSGTDYGVVGISQANIGAPGIGVPVYSFSEIGPGPSNGTIDVSQVDLYSFPVTITATVSPGNPSTIGTSPTVTFADNSAYSKYMNALAGTNGCSQSSTAAACPYLDLVSQYENSYSILLNPDGFLSSITLAAQNSRLNSAFDVVIGKLWDVVAPPIILNNGGPQGSAPQESFKGTVVTMTYPCNSTGTGCPTTTALKFVGDTSRYVAYVFNPKGYEQGCTNGAITDCPAGCGRRRESAEFRRWTAGPSGISVGRGLDRRSRSR